MSSDFGVIFEGELNSGTAFSQWRPESWLRTQDGFGLCANKIFGYRRNREAYLFPGALGGLITRRDQQGSTVLWLPRPWGDEPTQNSGK
jgi:hypothetical protein